jgi:NADH-quinone oxidoreductase subunit F
VLFNSARFYAHESCGQCTPCREGTDWMRKILERLRNGHGTERDIDLLVELSGTMGIIPGTTICGLADGAAWPVKSALTKFRQDFVDYVKSGRKAAPARLVGAH